MMKTVYENIGETLYTETLENGLGICVLARPGFRKSCAFFAARYGGADRRFTLDGTVRDTPAGIAHYLEHKMFDMPDGSNVMQAFSAAGASPNAFTSFDMTAYHFTCTERFSDNLRLLLRYVSTPYFTPESVQKEQGIIGQEIRMGEDSPGNAVYYGLLGALYAAHPIREQIAGSVESIAEITPELLYDCHRAFYRPSNMMLCCVGDVDPEAVADIAREILPRERGEAPVPDYGASEALSPAATLAERRMAVSAPQFLLGAKLPWPTEGRERLRQRLLSELSLSFLAGESSPFYNKLYRQGLLGRDFGWEVDITAGTVTALLGGESKEPEKVLETFRQKLRDAAENGFDEGRFLRCRRALYGNYLLALESFMAAVRETVADRFCGYDALDIFSVLPTLTAEDCAAFTREALVPERLALSVVRPLD